MDEDLAPLPDAERQVNGLGQIYGTTRSRIYTGPDASEARVKTEAGGYRILQLAAHGILNDADPMYSHIVLSQSVDQKEDGLLEAWEMMNLNLDADMVVLSACETARGRVGAGEGVIGMSWALFIAGSPTTVVSQWKVDAASTTELMLEFHRRLNPAAAGRARPSGSKSEALRQAALRLLKSPQYRHPFYWAGFVIVGDAW
jgi:CHAT domain-containing protein